jgi:Transmembrane exosortase (Exosortase_EpsH)
MSLSAGVRQSTVVGQPVAPNDPKSVVAVRQDQVIRATWPTIFLSCALAAVTAALFFDVSRSLVTDLIRDGSGSLTNTLVALVVCAMGTPWRWIVARPGRTDLTGLIITGVGCAVLLTGSLAGDVFSTRVALALVMIGFAWTFWGRVRLASMAAPILVTLSCIPLPILLTTRVVLPLQRASLDVGGWLLENAGYPSYREVTELHLAGASIGVNQACGDLRTLGPLIVTSLFFSAKRQQRSIAAAVLLAGLIPLSIAMDAIHIVGTGVLTVRDAAPHPLLQRWIADPVFFVMTLGIIWWSAGVWPRRPAKRAA